jgi:hypothetical protein
MLTLRALGFCTGTSVQLLTLLAFYAGGCVATSCFLRWWLCRYLLRSFSRQLPYWYKSTDTDAHAAGCDATCCALSPLRSFSRGRDTLLASDDWTPQVLTFLALLVQKYKRRLFLLYWYKSTNADSTRLIVAAPV